MQGAKPLLEFRFQLPLPKPRKARVILRRDHKGRILKSKAS